MIKEGFWMPSANLDARMSFDQGQSYFGKQEFDRAAEHYKVALGKDPHYVEAHQQLAEAYEKLGYAHRAKKAWEALIRVCRDPDIQETARQRMGKL
jgi:Tfp pilus assembly protein PilF